MEDGGALFRNGCAEGFARGSKGLIAMNTGVLAIEELRAEAGALPFEFGVRIRQQRVL